MPRYCHKFVFGTYLLSIVLVVFALVGCCTGVGDVAECYDQLWEPSMDCYEKKSHDVVGGSIEVGEGLGLPRLVDIALGNNPQTRQAWYLAKSASAQVGQRCSSYYPQVNLAADGRYRSDKNVLVEGDDESKSVGVGFDITYLLYNFGKRYEEKASAQQLMYAANFDYNQVYHDVLLDVQVAYFSLLAAKESLVSSYATLKDAQLAYDNATEKLKQGVGTRQDKLRSFASVKNAQARISRDKARIESTKAQLAKVSGVDPAIEFDVLEYGGEEHFSVLDEELEGLLLNAMERRPVLKASYARVLSRTHAINAAKKDYYPELFLGTSGAVDHVMDRSYNPTASYELTLGVRWSVFEGFNRKYRVLDAKALEKVACEELREQELAVMAQVWGTYYTYKSSLEQLDANKATLEASQEAYNAIQLGFEVGTTNIVEVLQSLSELSDAREQLVQSQADVYIELAKLTQATGRIPAFKENQINVQ